MLKYQENIGKPIYWSTLVSIIILPHKAWQRDAPCPRAAWLSGAAGRSPSPCLGVSSWCPRRRWPERSETPPTRLRHTWTRGSRAARTPSHASGYRYHHPPPETPYQSWGAEQTHRIRPAFTHNNTGVHDIPCSTQPDTFQKLRCMHHLKKMNK